MKPNLMLESLMFKRIEFWIVILIVISGLVATFLFGWIVQYKATGGQRGGGWAELALSIAEAPEPLVRLIVGGTRAIQPQMVEFADFSGFQLLDSHFRDDGFLLVSGYRPETKIATVYLYDIASKTILHQWVPPIDHILQNSSYHGDENSALNYRAQHPLLLGNGDVVFTSGEGPLVRIDKCGQLVWVVDRHFHHSIEQNAQGAFIVPHVIASPDDVHSVTSDNNHLGPIRDDGFAVVSPDGHILQESSITQILEDNGYIGLLYGVGEFETDRIHLNDAEPILRTDEYVEVGDVVLSSRNLSTVFLFRPSTQKIIWLKTGPWLNQHDVDYQGEGIFTVFGNDIVRTELGNKRFALSSAIHQYDQSTGRVEKIYNLEANKIFTPTQGLHDVLDNGDVFVEETDKHMLHRISAKGPRWRYVNTTGDNVIGTLHWSRYISKANASLEWLARLNCYQS